MSRFVKGLLRLAAAAVFWGAVLAGGYKLVKAADRGLKAGLWPAEPQLESVDPWERAEAARLAAKRSGGAQ